MFRMEKGWVLKGRAVDRLKLRYPNLGCLILGRREQYAEAEDLIRRAGMGHQILLIGDEPHEVCLDTMALSDLFVRPTIEDGDAIYVRQALSLGVPVVASNVGTRPPDATLFKAGDLEDLLSKLEAGLTNPRGLGKAAAGTSGA